MLSQKAVHYRIRMVTLYMVGKSLLMIPSPQHQWYQTSCFRLQAGNSLSKTEISPISKLFLWFCIFAHLGGFCIFLYNANLKMQDTDAKVLCYHLLFLKFFCLGGNSYILNKSLFERHSLLRTFKCSSKRGKWSSYVLMSSWKTWKETSLVCVLAAENSPVYHVTRSDSVISAKCCIWHSLTNQGVHFLSKLLGNRQLVSIDL